MTIRQIYEMVKADGEEFLDAELHINVRGNKVACANVGRDLWAFPRSASNARTGEPARISMDVYLDDKYVLAAARGKGKL